MKVLFVGSANNKSGISPIIKAQGESLKKKGITIDYLLIQRKGLLGYLNSIPKIKIIIRRGNYELIHAHYSLSGFAAALSGARPLIVSLMGSDIKAFGFFKFLILFFNRFFWNRCMVKSEDMKRSLGMNKVDIIANGVDLEKFKPISRELAFNKLGWNKFNYHILFASDPLRTEKNYPLFEKSLKIIEKENSFELHNLTDVPHEQVYLYMNASDVVVITSHYEGSPNVIKEAMACNRPIVSTNVGDVSYIIGNTQGCFISNSNPEEVALKLKKALDFSKKKGITSGRERIIELGLDDETIAQKIINVYKEVIGK